jgi:hypothetical protein
MTVENIVAAATSLIAGQSKTQRAELVN